MTEQENIDDKQLVELRMMVAKAVEDGILTTIKLKDGKKGFIFKKD